MTSSVRGESLFFFQMKRSSCGFEGSEMRQPEATRSRQICIKCHNNHKQAKFTQLISKRRPMLEMMISHFLALTIIIFAASCSSKTTLVASQALKSYPSANQPVQGLLLDTTEQKTLGWTKYPDGVSTQTRMPGWAEESFTQFERGINWRSFVVCDVAFNSVNNWLWSPWIERHEANRLYIEIKFTMRACNLFPELVLSCKETFALLYKEMDAPLLTQSTHLASNLSFAQADTFTLIDAIAADEGRSTSNRDVVINTEVRSIPVTKRGLYFAFRDQGACLSLISVKVYHLSCPALASQFALFNATPTGRDLTSLVTVEGQCVANALQIEQPRMFCGADGQWNSMSSGQCKCLAGFEPALNNTKCQACPPGKFKASLGDAACTPCPEHSYAPYAGASECRCQEGYFRAPRDSRAAACSQAPSAPQALQANYVDSSSVILQWQAPKYTGNRDDLTYKIQCDNCNQQDSQQNSINNNEQQQTAIVSSPKYLVNFTETQCVLSGLAPNTQYKFLVYAMNGVSSQAAASQSYANPLQAPPVSEISIQTLKAVQQSPQNTLLSQQNNLQPLPIYNFRILQGVRGSDVLLAWDAAPISQQQQQQLLTPPGDATIGAEMTPVANVFEIRVLPRRSLLGAGPAFDTTGNSQRRSPYPVSLISPASLTSPFGPAAATSGSGDNFATIVTSSRALVLSSLAPATEYAFQMRAKWSPTNANQDLQQQQQQALASSAWSDWSEPIFGTTPNNPTPASMISFDYEQVPPHTLLSASDPSLFPLQTGPTVFAPPPAQQQQHSIISALPPSSANQSTSWLSWLAGAFLLVLTTFGLLALLSLAFVRFKQSRKAQSCLSSLGAGFGGSSSAGGYAGVYGGIGVSGFESSLMGAGTLHQQHHHGATLMGGGGHAHHGHTLSASSAGGLITGSNTTSRSSSSGGGGAANVVQNFITATLSQFTGNANNHNRHSQIVVNANHPFGLQKGAAFATARANPKQALGQQHQQQSLYQSAANGKLFASSANLAGGQHALDQLEHQQRLQMQHQHQQQVSPQHHQRNLYHQASPLLNQQQTSQEKPFQHLSASGPNHTLLLASQEQQGLFQAAQQRPHQQTTLIGGGLISGLNNQSSIYHNQLSLQQANQGLFQLQQHESLYDDPLIDRHLAQALKYSRANQSHAASMHANQLMMQQQQQNHIYDDLESNAIGGHSSSGAQSETCSAADEPATTNGSCSSSSDQANSKQQRRQSSFGRFGGASTKPGPPATPLQQPPIGDTALNRAQFYANGIADELGEATNKEQQYQFNGDNASNQQPQNIARRQMI